MHQESDLDPVVVLGLVLYQAFTLELLGEASFNSGAASNASHASNFKLKYNNRFLHLLSKYLHYKFNEFVKVECCLTSENSFNNNY